LLAVLYASVRPLFTVPYSILNGNAKSVEKHPHPLRWKLFMCT
jgi:hypothetical protein